MTIPRRLNKPCNYPGCPELVKAGQTYCKKHSKKEISRKNNRYDREQRDERAAKFYHSSAWRKLRRIKMKEDPLCEMCLEEGRTEQADMVDHIVPVQVDWPLRLVKDNLQSLCNRCHAEKTAEERDKYT